VGLPLKVIFRTDASPIVGYGHLIRCRVLANALRDLGVACVMVGPQPSDRTDADAHLFDEWLEQSEWSAAGDDACKLAALANKHGCDVAVLDDYRVDVDYQKVMLDAGLKWLQFDSFASQKMLANWVLSASAAASYDRYEPLRERSETLFLLGPKYALLRSEFIEWKPRHRFSENVQKILLAFGGGDDRGATLFCLTALTHVWESIEAVILLRSSSPHLVAIHNWVSQNKRLKINIRVDEQEIARRMSEADLALIAGGMTTFEVASMGLPALILQIADNQALNARAWDVFGAAKFMGNLEEMHGDDLRQSVQLLLGDSERRLSMSLAGKNLVDCLGSKRVANILMNKDIPVES
jgi:UDP-2,4-diacetamido-2,4,6-trideoxy-beta-L-altropyranose hydrolase